MWMVKVGAEHKAEALQVADIDGLTSIETTCSGLATRET